MPVTQYMLHVYFGHISMHLHFLYLSLMAMLHARSGSKNQRPTALLGNLHEKIKKLYILMGLGNDHIGEILVDPRIQVFR